MERFRGRNGKGKLSNYNLKNLILNLEIGPAAPKGSCCQARKLKFDG